MPQEHLLEAPILDFWILQYLFLIQDPLQVAQVAKLLISYGNRCYQLGVAVAVSKPF